MEDLDYPRNAKRPTITVPVAVTQSCEPPLDLFPRSIAERAASDIRQYSAPGRGGHFLPFEEPRLIAHELGAFMRSIGWSGPPRSGHDGLHSAA